MFKVIIIYFLLEQCLGIEEDCTLCKDGCCEGTECKEVGNYKYRCTIPTTPGIILTKYYLYPKKKSKRSIENTIFLHVNLQAIMLKEMGDGDATVTLSLVAKTLYAFFLGFKKHANVTV